ncbi:MAG: hypothetical protein AAFQ81_05930 [Pseudomonadota bacterium]
MSHPVTGALGGDVVSLDDTQCKREGWRRDYIEDGPQRAIGN